MANASLVSNITNATVTEAAKNIHILGLPPLWFILVMSIVLSLATTLIYKYATDQNLIKQIREDMKKYQEQMKLHKDDPHKIAEIQSLMMPLNSKLMMQSMKPMLITTVPFLIVFAILSKLLVGLVVIPLPFHFPLSSLPTGLGWVGTYVIFSLIFTTAFRKLMKVV